MVRQTRGLYLWLWGIFGLGLTISGCVTDIIEDNQSYDRRALSVQTLSLYNQRDESRLTGKSWKADWIFRRDRLALIDLELRNIKPDVFSAQQVMSKRGSPSESDRNILLAGALSDYDWRETDVRSFPDTDEIQSMAVAVNTPVKVQDPSDSINVPLQQNWTMGEDGYLTVNMLEFEGQPIDLYNVEMPSDAGRKHVWYTFIQDRIRERVRASNVCMQRVIVAGFLPGDQDSRRFNTFLDKLKLKDSSQGFCQIASDCFTATPTNELFLATEGEETPSRTDRILVHQSALIFSSGVNVQQANATNRYRRLYGVSKVWPSQRFGWNVSVRLPRCAVQSEQLH